MTAALLLATLGMLAPGVPVQISPPAPTVGDRITIAFPEAPEGRIQLAPSEQYEIVSEEGNRAVIRSFRPGEIVVAGTMREPARSWAFPRLEIGIESVLTGDDALEPAPLRPPRELPPNRVAWAAIAGMLALAAWLWARVLRAPLAEAPAVAKAAPSLAPARELLRELDRAAAMEPHAAYVAVAAATRTFLARVDRRWTLDLTSRELRRELRRRPLRTDLTSTVDDILRYGDIEKFSGRGADADRDALVAAARRLVDLAGGEP